MFHVLRADLSDIDEHVVVSDPTTRQIQHAHALFSPLHELKQSSIALFIETAALGKLVGNALWIGKVKRRVFPFCGKLERPLLAPQAVELVHESGSELHQVHYVGMSVVHELSRKRAHRPIGARVTLLDADIKHALEEVSQANTVAIATE